MSETVKKAGFLQLAFMIYGASCGGAFGAETMVSQSGPGMALLSLAVVPFFFSLPIAFAVGELTAAHPVEGGNYRWSQMAFGEFWGLQAAWWLWMTGMMTNVVFTSLFTNYLKNTWYPGMGDMERWLVCVALVWAVHFVNWRGIDLVGNASIVLTIALLAPFAYLTVIGLMGWKTSPIVPFANPSAGTGLAAFGSSLGLSIFLYSGYDKLSAVAEEVEEPQKNFPPALVIAVTAAALSYLVPTAVCVAALGNWSEWGDGYFTTAALKLSGSGLSHSLAIAGMLSNALLLNVTMLAISRVPLALAEDGWLPGVFARHHPVHHTPTVSLIFGSVTCSLLSYVPLDSVLVVNAWLQMTTNVLIFANVWKLRRMNPDAPVAFRFPGGGPGLVIGTLTITAFAALAIYSSVLDPKGELDTTKVKIAVLGVLSGIVGYAFVAGARSRSWKDVEARKQRR